MNHDLQDFAQDVTVASQTVPVLVDFWAPWCGPCKMLGPVLEKLAAEAAGRWRLVKIDTERHPELAQQFGIRGIPDVRLFHQGAVVAQFSGALPEPRLRDWLAQHLPSLTGFFVAGGERCAVREVNGRAKPPPCSRITLSRTPSGCPALLGDSHRGCRCAHPRLISVTPLGVDVRRWP